MAIIVRFLQNRINLRLYVRREILLLQTRWGFSAQGVDDCIMLVFNLLVSSIKQAFLRFEVGAFFVRSELGVFGIYEWLNFTFCAGVARWLGFFHLVFNSYIGVLQPGNELLGLFKACLASCSLAHVVDWEDYVLMELLVHGKLARLAERFIAASMLAFERLLTCVDVHMLLQILAKRKALKTTLAGVLLNVRVQDHVSSKWESSSVGFVTTGALAHVWSLHN